MASPTILGHLEAVDDESDIIAFAHNGSVYCLTCALDEFGVTPQIPLAGPAAPIHASDSHPPAGLMCNRCNDTIVEPIWHDPALYVLELQNTEDDPTQILAIVRGEHARDWAEYHGSLAGGTWECADGPDFIYDLLMWEPDLIDYLREQGFRLNLAEYSDPDEEDLAIVEHASTCEKCEYDYHRAREHLASLGTTSK